MVSPALNALICIEIKGGLLFGVGLDTYRDAVEFLKEVSDVIWYVSTVSTEKISSLRGRIMYPPLFLWTQFNV